MAARAFQQKLNNLVEQLTLLQCRFDVVSIVQATGAVSGGPFVAGEVITGGSSNAVGTLISFVPGAFVNGAPPSAGALIMSQDATDGVPAFQSGETLTGGTSGATVTSTSVGYSGPSNVQGNGFGAAGSGGVLRSPVAAGTGVLGSYQLQLSDSYNYLMDYCAAIQPPGLTATPLTDGNLVVGANYLIASVGTQNFVAALTISSGTATATIGGVAVVVTYATSQNATTAALAAAINANAGLSQVARASASTNNLTITPYNPNPPVAIPVTVAASAGSWSLALSGQASMPATGWHYLGLPASVVPAVGAQFQALHTGSLSHAGDGTVQSAYALSGTAAVDGANLLVLGAGKPDLGLRSSVPGGNGGYLNLQGKLASTGAAADLPVGARVYISLLLRNSTVKGKGE